MLHLSKQLAPLLLLLGTGFFEARTTASKTCLVKHFYTYSIFYDRILILGYPSPPPAHPTLCKVVINFEDPLSVKL